MRATRWLEVTVTVSPEAVEAVGAKLLDMGARGYALRDVGETRALVAYFPGTPSMEQALASFVDFVGRLPSWGLDPGPGRVEVRLADEAEWRDQWRQFYHPVQVGRRMVVRPPWESWTGPGAGDAGGDVSRDGPRDFIEIVIDPGQAFGTGHHATTRGALELVEMAVDMQAWPQDRETAVLDLGTGSGILAVGAAKLGLAGVLAVDDDPIAVEAARANVAANEVAVEVVEGDAFELLRGRPAVDLITANLTTDQIAFLIPAAAAALSPEGLFVSAGISQGEGATRIREAAGQAGLEEVAARESEGWTSLLFRRARAPGDGGRPRARPLSQAAGRAVFYTLGCKANLYDTAGMMSQLGRAGWTVLTREEVSSCDKEEGPAEAGLYVVNSCAVTARAEAKSRQLSRKLKREHPEAIVALVGCYPQIARGEALQASGADLILGTEDREKLIELLEAQGAAGRPLAPAGGRRPGATSENSPAGCPARFSSPSPADGVTLPGVFAGDRTRATVKVQEGCDESCSYCVIPHARGPGRSRPAADVLAEVSRLVRRGFREVVLTGIHLGSWGLDLGQGMRLADLVGWIASIPGLDRLRLSSIELLEVTGPLLAVMAASPNVCPHLHIPLQSGSDTVLARMNRHYKAARYLEVVDRVRARLPLAAITTDVMVGFPGETAGEFAATLDVVRRARFSRLHVFRYSPRPGTPAAAMPEQVDTQAKKARSEELIRLGRELARQFRESLVGKVLDVLVEEADGAWASGFTGNYVRVAFTAAAPQRNTVVPVSLERVTRDGLLGRLA